MAKFVVFSLEIWLGLPSTKHGDAIYEDGEGINQHQSIIKTVVLYMDNLVI